MDRGHCDCDEDDMADIRMDGLHAILRTTKRPRRYETGAKFRIRYPLYPGIWLLFPQTKRLAPFNHTIDQLNLAVSVRRVGSLQRIGRCRNAGFQRFGCAVNNSDHFVDVGHGGSRYHATRLTAHATKGIGRFSAGRYGRNRGRSRWR
jgi:hypothetical protein